MKNRYKIYTIIGICILQCNAMGAQFNDGQTTIPQNYEWAKSMGFGGTFEDEGRAVTTDTTGNVYFTGAFTGTVDFDPGTDIAFLTASGIDIFIAKLDADGNYIWAKKLGGSLGDEGFGIAIDSSDNVYITGVFYERIIVDTLTGTVELNSAGASDIFIAKLDSSGNFIWAKNMGGPSHDQGNAIALDALGNVCTTGFFKETADFDPEIVGIHELNAEGGKDIFISKLDASGNFIAAMSMGGNSDDVANSIALDASGNIFTTGFFKDKADFNPKAGIHKLVSEGGKDIFISKLDANANFLAAKKIGGSGSDEGNSIIVDANGNIHMTGHFSGTVDFDPKAGTHNLYSEGKHDIFVAKLDAQGNLAWAKNIGGTDADEGASVTLDVNGNVYTIGSFKDHVDFDPDGVEIYELTALDHEDIFISKLDASGNFIWAKSMGGDGNDNGYGISVNAGFDVYTTGGFMDRVDFDTETGVDIIDSFGDFDIFVHKLSPDLGSTVPIDVNKLPVVFPNPATQNLTLDLKHLYNTVTLYVRNFNGELVSAEEYRNKDKIDFHINGSPGMYFVEVMADGVKIQTLKVVKQ